MYMMFPLCVLGAIVVSSMLVKAFFVGLPSSSTFLFFFFFIPPTTLIRVYANDLMQRSEWGRHNGNLFLRLQELYTTRLYFFCMCARILSLSLPLPSFIDFQRRLGVLQEENKNPTLFIGIYACNVMWYMVRICNNHRMPWCTILLHLHSNDWGILYNALQESWIATCAFLIQLQTIKASLLVLWHFVWAKRHRVLM